MSVGLLLFLVIPLIVLVVGATITVLAFGGSALLYKLFGRMSGLDELAAFYPAPDPPQGDCYPRQVIQVGPVRYRYSTEVWVNPH